MMIRSLGEVVLSKIIEQHSLSTAKLDHTGKASKH